MSVTVYTYGTDAEKLRFLNQTADFHQVPLKNLCTTNQWTGFQDKLKAIHTALDSHQPTDIVCFVDAYDVLVNASVEEMEKSFKQENCDLLFGAEVDCFPHGVGERLPPYPESPTKFRYLNSGCYIGYVHAIRALLSHDSYEGKDDQEHCHKYFFKSANTHLDVKASFVLNMSRIPWTDLAVAQGKIAYTPLNTRPCFVHFNGMSYMDIYRDFQRLPDGNLSFAYEFPYSTTFLALYGSKMLTNMSPIICTLSGRGHTY